MENNALILSLENQLPEIETEFNTYFPGWKKKVPNFCLPQVTVIDSLTPIFELQKVTSGIQLHISSNMYEELHDNIHILAGWVSFLGNFMDLPVALNFSLGFQHALMSIEENRQKFVLVWNHILLMVNASSTNIFIMQSLVWLNNYTQINIRELLIRLIRNQSFLKSPLEEQALLFYFYNLQLSEPPDIKYRLWQMLYKILQEQPENVAAFYNNRRKLDASLSYSTFTRYVHELLDADILLKRILPHTRKFGLQLWHVLIFDLFNPHYQNEKIESPWLFAKYAGSGSGHGLYLQCLTPGNQDAESFWCQLVNRKSKISNNKQVMVFSSITGLKYNFSLALWSEVEKRWLLDKYLLDEIAISSIKENSNSLNYTDDDIQRKMLDLPSQLTKKDLEIINLIIAEQIFDLQKLEEDSTKGKLKAFTNIRELFKTGFFKESYYPSPILFPEMTVLFIPVDVTLNLDGLSTFLEKLPYIAIDVVREVIKPKVWQITYISTPKGFGDIVLNVIINNFRLTGIKILRVNLMGGNWTFPVTKYDELKKQWIFSPNDLNFAFIID